jgi:hypothetical protein
MWGVLSDERSGLQFTLAAGPRQYILSQTWDSSNLKGQISVLISTKKSVAQLHPQALGLSNLLMYHYIICL